MTPTQSELIERLAGALRESTGLRLAVPFGSTARGTRRPDSDLDVGIIPVDPETSLGTELDLQNRLEQACERSVHLVRLDRASTLRKWKVATEGRLLVSNPPHSWPRFVAMSAIEYAEFAPQLEQAEERFRARLAETGQA